MNASPARRIRGSSPRALLAALRALGAVRAPATLAPAVREAVGLGDRYARLTTPIGRVFVAYGPGGVSAVQRAPSPAAFEEAFRTRFGRAVRPAGRPPAALVRAVRRQLRGERAGLRFDLAGLSEFERAVLGKALEIPRGEVRTYAWVAREIGRPQAVRAVGSALGRNPVPLLIPCHRVVRSDGRIGDYVFGAPAKQAALAAEGVRTESRGRLAPDGARYVGSATTRIYCLPTCRSARRITARHRRSFRSAGAAGAAGYRPCRLCRPASARSA
ncbi:MAG TPA: methylated-DNA--[protein]-cysteine S-methyltransferase [Methylomirabilota bacterium]|nr:methylated-DNA--[protein]-cysteine S-methyltransferase [Methylomirabilota bacterium]